jgi:micrococcal nuclease
MKDVVGLALALAVFASSSEARSRLPLQSRPHGAHVEVESSAIRVMDGDTIELRWSAVEVETVRVLGIDAPELFLGGRGGSVKNPAGTEARGFARGAFATAHRVELLRAATRDRYGRTLGYFFLDGRNYSVLALRSGMAFETISRFGDNDFPREAAEVTEAARLRSRRN